MQYITCNIHVISFNCFSEVLRKWEPSSLREAKATFHGQFKVVVCYSPGSLPGGGIRSAKIFIFPAKYEEIADFITRDVYRGVTVSKGWDLKN